MEQLASRVTGKRKRLMKKSQDIAEGKNFFFLGGGILKKITDFFSLTKKGKKKK